MKGLNRFAAVALTAALLVVASMVCVPQTAEANGGSLAIVQRQRVVTRQPLFARQRVVVRQNFVQPVAVQAVAAQRVYAAPVVQQVIVPQAYYAPQAFRQQVVTPGCAGSLQLNGGGCQALYGR